jgi:peptidoglycan/xylan/chitin deacetylase (PgdA/CDA1 family)
MAIAGMGAMAVRSRLLAMPVGLLCGVLLLASWPLLALARRLLPPLLPEVLFCAPGAGRRLALTIDDGPSPASGQLLDLLGELQVPATLFLIADHLERGPAGFVQRALAEGHQIGNHMQEDCVSARLDAASFMAQLLATERALQQAAAPRELRLRWFRPGGGWFHGPMLRQLNAAGYRLALGSLFPLDTFHPPGWFLRRFLLLHAQPGAVIVLHDRPDTLPATLATLQRVVPLLQRRGYRFVTLDGLVQPEAARDPGKPA